ncbi:MerR family transcriptional regulator [Actinomadura meridiana]|uniref:MerR family transcriptional regulator n=1 Tax=Actinomadura meridiana TaxID=559626 RepID=UPI0031EAC6B7
MREEPLEDQDGRTAREYRIGELARATGVPVRTLRYYQERRLLPPPRRAGRVGLYSDDHRARLRVIAELLDRGHTLEGIRDLLSAWEDGRDLGAVLGFEKPTTTAPPPNEPTPGNLPPDEPPLSEPPSDELPPHELSPGELSPGELPPHKLPPHELPPDELPPHELSPGELAAPLVDEIQRGMDELAAMFGRLLAARGTGDHDPGELAEALARLRPAAQLAVGESFARAMDHQVRAARRAPEA